MLGISVTIESSRCDDVRFTMERVKEPDDLITVLIKLDRFILQNSVDHLRGLFHQVDLLGIMIKQMESSIVDGYLTSLINSRL